MTDRLPEPVALADSPALLTERASATPDTGKSTSSGALHDAGSARIDGPSNGARGAPRGDPRAPVPRSLAEVQAWMLRTITGESDAVAPAAAVLTRGPKLDADARLDVYRNGYHARLVECLLDDYPVLSAFLGHQRFHALCHGYIAHHPSRAPNLNRFGRHMADFCATEAAGLRDDVGMAEGLARLEWAIVEVLHAEVAPRLDLSPLASLPPEAWGEARFTAGEAVRVVHATHPVNAWLQAYRQSDERPPVPAPEPSATAVYRTPEFVWRMPLTPAMARVLESLLAGEPLGEALDKIQVDETDAEAIAEAERNVMVWFREWLGSGLFSGITLLDAP